MFGGSSKGANKVTKIPEPRNPEGFLVHVIARIFGLSPFEMRRKWSWEQVKLEHDNAMDYNRIETAHYKKSSAQSVSGASKAVRLTPGQFVTQFGTHG